MVREIITDWTTPAGGGFVSVMYFDPTILVETQRAALGSLWSAIGAHFLFNLISFAILATVVGR